MPPTPLWLISDWVKNENFAALSSLPSRYMLTGHHRSRPSKTPLAAASLHFPLKHDNVSSVPMWSSVGTLWDNASKDDRAETVRQVELSMVASALLRGSSLKQPCTWNISSSRLTCCSSRAENIGRVTLSTLTRKVPRNACSRQRLIASSSSPKGPRSRLDIALRRMPGKGSMSRCGHYEMDLSHPYLEGDCTTYFVMNANDLCHGIRSPAKLRSATVRSIPHVRHLRPVRDFQNPYKGLG